MIRSVERFFEFSILGLVASGFFALAASGSLDRPTMALSFLALLLRAARVAGLMRFSIPPRTASLAALAYIVFYPIDFYTLSGDFLTATVHGVCFLASIKILTATTNRDYVYTGAISFVELVAAALLSSQASFFAWLGLYIAFAIAAFTSGEIRRGLRVEAQTIAPPKARIAWRLMVVAGDATLGILVVTAGLFLIVPRTARMAAMMLPGSPRLTGFANVVDLGGFGRISRDDRAVLHIQSYSRALPPNIKWRGAALSHFDGRRWFEPAGPEREIPAVHGRAVVADEYQRSRRDGRRLLYRVDVQNSDTGTLFVAGIPEYVNVDAPRLLETRESSLHVPGPPSETLRYEVSAHSGPPLGWPLSKSERARNLALPAVDVRIFSLAREWAGDAAPGDAAQRIEGHLQKDFRYKLDGPEKPVRDPLADFLFVRREGYCEYFASAMTVMLRSLGIPARVATGFQSGYLNEVSGLYVVRASDAHAWVEAWIEGRGWTTFDPTPPAATPGRAGLLSRLNMYFDAADHAWQEWVVSYDLGHQVLMASRMEAAIRGWSRRSSRGEAGPWASLWVDAKKWGGWLLAGLVMAGLGIYRGPGWWRAWRRQARVNRLIRVGGKPSDAALLYRGMLEALRKRGFEKPGWFTPSEFARTLPAGQLEPMEEFTGLYNAARFGGDPAALSRLAALLRDMEA